MKTLFFSVCAGALLASCAAGPHPVITSHMEPMLATNAAGVVTVRDAVVYEVSTNALNFVHAAQQIGATVATFAPPAAPVVTLLNGFLALAIAGVGLYAKAKTNAAEREVDATYAAGDRAIATMIAQTESKLRTESEPMKLAELNSQLATLEKERGKLTR